MKPMLRNVLAILAGIVIGSVVNMALITVSGSIIPPPAGVDLTTMEGLKAAMPLMEPKHFLFPFLAHALGTLVGAIVTVKLVLNSHQRFAIILSGWFLLGGIINIALLPSSIWFALVDLLLAYIPFGYLGYWLAKSNK